MDPIEKGAQSLKREYFERDGTVVSDEKARADFQNLVEVFEMLLQWSNEEKMAKKKAEEKESKESLAPKNLSA